MSGISRILSGPASGCIVQDPAPDLQALALAAMPTAVFFPESAYGPTNNCVGIGDVLRRREWRVVFIIEESFEGKLAEHGFEERTMRLGPAPEHEEDPGQFWKDFIRETAPRLPQADDRADRGVHRPDLRGARRRCPLRRRAPGRDHRRGRARRDRRGQRGQLPGVAGERPSVGADRLLQPGGDQGSRRFRRRSPATRRRPLRLGRVPARVPAGDRPDAGGVRLVLPRARGAAAARARDDPRLELAQPLALPARGRLRARRPAGGGLAQPRVERAEHRSALAAARAAGRRAGAAGLSQPRLTRLR